MFHNSVIRGNKPFSIHINNLQVNARFFFELIPNFFSASFFGYRKPLKSKETIMYAPQNALVPVRNDVVQNGQAPRPQNAVMDLGRAFQVIGDRNIDVNDRLEITQQMFQGFLMYAAQNEQDKQFLRQENQLLKQNIEDRDAQNAQLDQRIKHIENEKEYEKMVQEDSKCGKVSKTVGGIVGGINLFATGPVGAFVTATLTTAIIMPIENLVRKSYLNELIDLENEYLIQHPQASKVDARKWAYDEMSRRNAESASKTDINDDIGV